MISSLLTFLSLWEVEVYRFHCVIDFSLSFQYFDHNSSDFPLESGWSSEKLSRARDMHQWSSSSLSLQDSSRLKCSTKFHIEGKGVLRNDVCHLRFDKFFIQVRDVSKKIVEDGIRLRREVFVFVLEDLWTDASTELIFFDESLKIKTDFYLNVICTIIDDYFICPTISESSFFVSVTKKSIRWDVLFLSWRTSFFKSIMDFNKWTIVFLWNSSTRSRSRLWSPQFSTTRTSLKLVTLEFNLKSVILRIKNI